MEMDEIGPSYGDELAKELKLKKVDSRHALFM